MCVSVSGFAFEVGDFVYTPQGRFQITGANQNADNAFQTMAGWTVFAAEGKVFSDLFNTNANGLADGFNSIQSTAATAGEGIYFKFEPTDASATYVVSFKMKGALLDNIRTRIPGDGYKTESNVVKIAGNAEGVFNSDSLVVVANTAEELNENWQTFNYAIQGDGIARTWFISFDAMATTIEIADLEIMPAMQFADLRQRDAMLEKMKAYRDCYDWKAETLDEYGYNEAIANLEAIGDEDGQQTLDELLETAQEIIADFLNHEMDDYLAGNNDNYLGIKTTSGNTQKVSNYGDWKCLPDGRAFWNSGDYPDLGHFGGNNSWCYNSPDSPMGVYMQKTLDPGSYVFAIESNSALREDPTSTSWTINEGWDPAYAEAYIVKMVDGAATDTVVKIVKGLEAVNFTPFIITTKIEEAGIYEIGLKAYCKEDYKTLANGSVVYVRNASIMGKNDNKYNQKQLGYEANVRAQITAGRENLTKANEYLNDDSYYWGKAELKECVDSIETKIAAYEALDQDAIIATYDIDTYQHTTADSTGLLEFEVYQQATKWIIAANKKFEAVNDTLNSIQVAISDAEAVMVQRLYDAATGKAELLAAINAAKAVQAQMKAVDYSEENAATIVAAIETLTEAVETFKTTVPASAIATLVDIDFENEAVQDPETQLYSVSGATGKMIFSSWSTDGTGNQPFEKGFWSNGEQLWKGYIRIGSGTGTAEFDPTENGSMGTNILRVACDFYVQGLSGRSLGFFLKKVVNGEDGPEDSDIFGLFHNFYNGTTSTNTCNVDISKIWAKSGGSYNNASPADATDSVTTNPLQKSHIEVILDYGKKTMYCTISSVNGNTTSEEIAIEDIPTKFVLQSNYNNNDRRAWFDNLLIQRISAGDPTGINTVTTTVKADNSYYTIGGIRVVKPTQKGVYIQKGKKVVIK